MIRAKYDSGRLKAAAKKAVEDKKKEDHPGKLTCRFQVVL